MNNIRTEIRTPMAPRPLGHYSQAIQFQSLIHLCGQLPLHPDTLDMPEDVEAQVHQVFRNLQAVAHGAGSDLAHTLKLNVYLRDLADAATVNQIMTHYFETPYPARTTLGVAALPKDALIEIDATLAPQTQSQGA